MIQCHMEANDQKITFLPSEKGKNVAKIDLEKKLEYVKTYIPNISNWLINDTVCSTLKVKKEKDQKMLWDFITPYLKSENQYEVRFAVVTMLDNFIIENYVDNVIIELDNIKNKEYYAEMAIAWTVAEIGIKFPVHPQIEGVKPRLYQGREQ